MEAEIQRRQSQFLFGWLIFCGALIASPGVGHADIAAFNAAVKAGTYRSAAESAAEVWATYDITKPSTALVAREFGWVSYLAGDYQQAAKFADFLVEQGPTLAFPDAQPAVSAVLLALAHFKLAKPDAANRLRDALETRLAADEATELLSVRAAEELYANDWSAQRWSDSAADATLAARLAERGGAALLTPRRRADVAARVSAFLLQREPRNYGPIAELTNAIAADIEASDPGTREALWPIYFRAWAWMSAIEGYANAMSHDTGTHIKNRLMPIPLKYPKAPRADALDTPATEPASESTACKGSVDLSSVSYPSVAEFKGLYGAAIVEVKIDQQGNVAKLGVLASVPSPIFGQAIERDGGGLKWVAAEDNPADCTLPSGRLISVRFTIR